jgi:hypothetical protein
MCGGNPGLRAERRNCGEQLDRRLDLDRSALDVR